jgi:hypothetical protein
MSPLEPLWTFAISVTGKAITADTGALTLLSPPGCVLWAGSAYVNYVIAIERLGPWGRFEEENVPGIRGVTLGKQFYISNST